MSECAVRVENVSKKFSLGQDVDYARLSELLQNTVLGWRKKRQSPALAHPQQQATSSADPNSFWALKDVSFEVERGQILGIIGRNGAGKSTLLKILSRITRPTSGQVGTRGRVGSLLEVGTGFHPELTGRENVFLNGSILGMKRREIERKFEEIVSFAEVDAFIDMPVKRYSSGMYMRLAFSVAAHLEPEILIIDEVLAVGDVEFQKKSLSKMQDVSRHGRTVLFVSHNMTAVKNLCTHGLYLDKGVCLKQGPIDEVIQAYHNRKSQQELTVREWPQAAAPGNEHVLLRKVSVKPLKGDELTIDSGVRFSVTAFVNKDHTLIDCALLLETAESVVMFHQAKVLADMDKMTPGWFQIDASLGPHILNFGQYRVTLIFAEDRSHTIYKAQDIVEFEIENQGSQVSVISKPGLLAPDLSWDIQQL